MSIVDTVDFRTMREVETGAGAHGVVVDPSSRHAYVTNIYGDDVAVLDLREQRVVARIPVGATPNGISFPQFAITSRPEWDDPTRSRRRRGDERPDGRSRVVGKHAGEASARRTARLLGQDVERVRTTCCSSETQRWRHLGGVVGAGRAQAEWRESQSSWVERLAVATQTEVSAAP